MPAYAIATGKFSKTDLGLVTLRLLELGLGKDLRRIRVRVNDFTCPLVLKPETHQTRFPSSDQLSGMPPVFPYSSYPNVRRRDRDRNLVSQVSNITTSRKEFRK